jgi:hypothetical protein
MNIRYAYTIDMARCYDCDIDLGDKNRIEFGQKFPDLVETENKLGLESFDKNGVLIPTFISREEWTEEAQAFYYEFKWFTPLQPCCLFSIDYEQVPVCFHHLHMAASVLVARTIPVVKST